METLFDFEETITDLIITEEIISCAHGKLEYYFDEDAAIVNSISVYLKRNGIGKRLVKELESLAQQNRLRIVEVPASPTKEAILFWKSLCYKPEDRYWSNKIIGSDKETAWDTPQGVVLMTKLI
jgi:N-acetylglutamate synthase-like GNAT family acetyltransferase